MTGIHNRTIFSGLLVITLAVIVMISLVVTVINAGCQRTFDTNLPLYPDARIEASDFPFLGNKWMELYIPLSTTEVRTWYNRAVYVPLANDLKNHTNTAWHGNLDIAEADDKTGTRVLLSVNCP
jgi:hypothetical protein